MSNLPADAQHGWPSNPTRPAMTAIDQLRAAARASFLLMDVSADHPEADALRVFLPGEGTEIATDEQIADVDRALAPRGLPVRRSPYGDHTYRPNVAYLRSELRRWAARQEAGLS